MTDPKNRLDDKDEASEENAPESLVVPTVSEPAAGEPAVDTPANDAEPETTTTAELIVTDAEPTTVITTEVVPAAIVETEVVDGEAIITDVEPAAVLVTEVVSTDAVGDDIASVIDVEPTEVASSPVRTGGAAIGARQLPKRAPVEVAEPASEPAVTGQREADTMSVTPAPDIAPTPEDTTLVDPPTAATSDIAAIGAKRSSKRSTGAARPKPSPEAGPSERPAVPYAVIETGGKQYRVSVGETVAVERLPDEAGCDLTLDRVLLLGGNGSTQVGTPTVTGATVTARVDDHYRGEKIVVFKYKPKKRYRRRNGHRQSLTHLTITGING